MLNTIQELENMRRAGVDSAIFYFSLGLEYAREKQWDNAIEALKTALKKDPGYSAAWKNLGRCYLAAGDYTQGSQVFREGIAIAELRGDWQIAREMRLLLKALKHSAEH
jgi:tetratricopeptide (TPR) repeat protein